MWVAILCVVVSVIMAGVAWRLRADERAEEMSDDDLA